MASTTTTEGVVPWPTDLAAQYREAGYWKDELLTAPIWRMAARRPDDIALVDGETRIGYAEMCRRADALGARLRELGFETDDRVVVQLPNTWEFVIFTLGCLRAGIIPVMALPAHRRHELEYLAEHSEAVAMVVPDILRDFDHQALAKAIRDAVPSVRDIIVLGDAHADAIDLRGLCALPADHEDPAATLDALPISPDAVALFLLSGGTKIEGQFENMIDMRDSPLACLTVAGRAIRMSDVAYKIVDAAEWLLTAGFVSGETIHVEGGARSA